MIGHVQDEVPAHDGEPDQTDVAAWFRHGKAPLRSRPNRCILGVVASNFQRLSGNIGAKMRHGAALSLIFVGLQYFGRA
jgi:hypothetical protein